MQPVEWLESPFEGRVLHLGCGLRPMANAVNHDRWRHSAWVDVDWNLDVYPWDTLRDIGSFDVVCSYDLFEHLADAVTSVNQAAELLRPGGLFVARWAAHDHEYARNDPTHVTYAGPHTLDYWDPETHLGYVYGRIYRDVLGNPLVPLDVEDAVRDGADWLLKGRRRG